MLVAVHGGSGSRLRSDSQHDRDGFEDRYRDGLRRALEAGRDALGRDGVIAAVEAAVVVLEDDEVFNAGRGAVYSADATIELEAAIMDGASRAAGAVGLVSHVKNPVRLARHVLRDSPHVMLAGPAAERFGAEHGLATVPATYFHTERRLRALLEGRSEFADGGRGSGTVGAVARDVDGRVAAATSTGGRTGKAVGRIGDTPVIGAGTWADDLVAVSGTGKGEYFVRTAACRTVAALIAHGGLDVGDAAARVIADIGKLGGAGGCIALDRDGDLAMPFDTEVMHRGYVTADGDIRVAVLARETPA